MPKKPLPPQEDDPGMSLADFNARLRILLTTKPPPVQRKSRPKPKPPKDGK